MKKSDIKKKLRALLRKHLLAQPGAVRSLVPSTVTDGKLYEAHVLSLVVEKLAVQEKYALVLTGGSKVQLKSSPGPINRKYPRIDLRKNGILRAELWTDVEFLSLSHAARGLSTTTLGDFHELDLLIVEAGQSDRPTHDKVWLGVECKHTSYQKGLLKEILGIRRELSLLTDLQPTQFSTWPRPRVPADPPSCLLVYSTDPSVKNYEAPGSIFGIDFVHEPL